jgi:hypothetical protein
MNPGATCAPSDRFQPTAPSCSANWLLLDHWRPNYASHRDAHGSRHVRAGDRPRQMPPNARGKVDRMSLKRMAEERSARHIIP